jgi:hypothetical protein
MTDEPEKKSATPAIILLLVAILVGVFVMTYGLQTLAWANWKWRASSDSWLIEVPDPLPPAPSTPMKGTKVRTFDFEFIAPWQGDPKVVPSAVGVQMHFNSGQVVFFYDPETLVDAVRKQKSSSPLEYQRFTNLFGENALDSNFSLYQLVYTASAAQLSPLMSARDALRLNVLLNWKLSFGYDARPGIHSFQWGKIRGYQFGDPVNSPAVAIRAFDDRDRQFRLIFGVTGGSPTHLTEDEVSSAVSTLQPVPILER